MPLGPTAAAPTAAAAAADRPDLSTSALFGVFSRAVGPVDAPLADVGPPPAPGSGSGGGGQAGNPPAVADAASVAHFPRFGAETSMANNNSQLQPQTSDASIHSCAPSRGSMVLAPSEQAAESGVWRSGTAAGRGVAGQRHQSPAVADAATSAERAWPPGESAAGGQWAPVREGTPRESRTPGTAAAAPAGAAAAAAPGLPAARDHAGSRLDGGVPGQVPMAVSLEESEARVGHGRSPGEAGRGGARGTAGAIPSSRSAASTVPAPRPATSSSSATAARPGGGPRVKVPAVNKGFSQLDWLKLQNARRGPPPRQIRMEEVKLHRVEGDAWTVLKGRVYNIGPYMNFHPGGRDMLMKAAGRDGTSLFDKYHAWVNHEFLLEKCLLGVLAAD